MNKLALSLALFLVTTLPGWSQTLEGKIETFESQEDLNSLDWTEWRKNIAITIHNKINRGIRINPGFYWGEVEAKVLITNSGKVKVVFANNRSILLDRLVYSSYKSLEKTSTIKFPSESHRREVYIDTIYSMTNGEDEVVYQTGDLEKI